MISQNPQYRTDATGEAWEASRRLVGRLPMLPSDPDDLEAILNRTIVREQRAGRLFRGTVVLAAAACIGIAALGAVVLMGDAEPQYSETELARLETEVELVFVQLGRVLHRTEQIAIGEVLGAAPIAPNQPFPGTGNEVVQ